MKTIKPILLALITAVVLSGCSTTYYYQYYTVGAEKANLSPSGNYEFTFDGVKFFYDFWGEYGNVMFVAYNSNEYDITIDLTQSSFIKNDIAEDYYKERHYIVGTNKGTSISNNETNTIAIASKNPVSIHSGNLSAYNLEADYGAALLASANTETMNINEFKGIIEAEQQKVIIPAKSAKVFCTFLINKTRYIHSDLYARSTYEPIRFTKGNTPVRFRNRICIIQNGESKICDMSFFVNGIANITFQAEPKPKAFYITYDKNYDARTR